MTGKQMIMEIINHNALNCEISIEINKRLIPDSPFDYEYFNAVEVVTNGGDLIIHSEVEI